MGFRRGLVQGFSVAAVLFAAAFCLSGCSSEGEVASQPDGMASSPWFEDVTEAAGIDFVHSPGRERRLWFPEIMTGGAGWLDYDDDGDLDLYLVQGGELDRSAAGIPGNRLYRNDGGAFVDVSDRSGVADRGYGMGVAAADYDGDGDTDFYVTNVGPNVLYRNEGDGSFSEVGDGAGVAHPGWGTSSGFFDYDGDGDLDLFVVNYLHWSPSNEVDCFSGEREPDYCGPSHYKAPAIDTLFRNDGDGRFTDVTASAGLESAFGAGLGLAFGDFDLDGHADLYVANDGMANQLWMNDGQGGFADRALLSGTALNVAGSVEAGMGVQAFDVEGDGDLDLFMAHLWGETNTLYLNSGGIFEDATPDLGLATPSFPMTGFGAGFADFDHDGRVDLYVANGGVKRSRTPYRDDNPFAEPNLLFRGTESGFEVAEEGTNLTENSRAAAFGDADGDGDVDVAVLNNGESARLLENRAADDGGGSISLRIVDGAGAPALGTRVRVDAAGQSRWSQVEPTYSYCASNDTRVHFGVGAATTVESVRIVGRAGRKREFRSLAPGRLYTLPWGGEGGR